MHHHILSCEIHRGGTFIRCVGTRSCTGASIVSKEDNHLYMEGTNGDSWMGATIILPRNGTFEGYRMAGRFMSFDGKDSTFLSVNVSESSSASLWKLNGIYYFRYEQTTSSQGMGMDVTFDHFAGDAPTVIFEEVAPVLGASAHIFLPVDGANDTGVPPHLILRARNASTLRSTEISPPRSFFDAKSRVGSLRIECPYDSTCDGLDLNSLILNKNGEANLICEGYSSCSNLLVGMQLEDDSILSFHGIGDSSLRNSKVSLDISHSQRVQINMNCTDKSCQTMIFDTSPIDVANNGSFIGYPPWPNDNSLEVTCFGMEACDNLAFSCPLHLGDISSPSSCGLKVENSSLPPTIDVYSFSSAEIECHKDANCSKITVHCGIGNPLSEEMLKCKMEEIGNTWECVGECSTFMANSSDVNQSYSLLPNKLEPLLSNEIFTFTTSENCTGTFHCQSIGIDCSSVFGRDSKHCIVLCDSEYSCAGTIVNCPRYAKGSGSCTLLCLGEGSCFGLTLS